MAKVTFDGELRTITVDVGEDEINIGIDVYSEWKNWLFLSDNAKWIAAMTSTGGDPLPGGEFLGSTFFMINGWKLLTDHSVIFEGNLFADDGSDPIIAISPAVIATSKVSTLVERVSVPAPNASIFV